MGRWPAPILCWTCSDEHQAPDRFEREKADFFQRVRAAYLRRAAAAPQRVRLIDASRKPDEIRAEVESIIVGACFQ